MDIESRKILRSGFDFTSNLTSVIGDIANHGFLASYVSRHTAMAHDTGRQRQHSHITAVLKKVARWQRGQSSGGGVRKRKTGGGIAAANGLC